MHLASIIELFKSILTTSLLYAFLFHSNTPVVSSINPSSSSLSSANISTAIGSIGSGMSTLGSSGKLSSSNNLLGLESNINSITNAGGIGVSRLESLGVQGVVTSSRKIETVKYQANSSITSFGLHNSASGERISAFLSIVAI